MSLAHKCDRCATLYEVSPGTARVSIIVTERVHDDDDGYTEGIDSYKDLCRECTTEFQAFFKPKFPAWPPK